MNTHLTWAGNTYWNVYSVSLVSSLSHSLTQSFHISFPLKKPPTPPSLFILAWWPWLTLHEKTYIIRWECPHILTSICETYLFQYLFLHSSSCYNRRYVSLPSKMHLSLGLQFPSHQSFKLDRLPSHTSHSLVRMPTDS